MREVFHEKHPTNCPVAAEAILPAGSQSFDSQIIFEEIDTAII